MHQTELISMIAAGLGLAFIFGLAAAKLRLPLLIGYLTAGLVVGPFTPGFVADKHLAQQLSEIGVSLLMFGVGLHFSIRDLLSVKNIAVPGALVQITVATLLGIGITNLWGWSIGAGLVFGLCLSVASTVVLLRALADRGEIETVNGRIAVGWLIVEDLVTVVALVALPVIAGAFGSNPSSGGVGSIASTLAITFLKVAVFAAIMLIGGKRIIPSLLGRVARTRSKELFTIGVLAIALGIAFGAAALFGVSPALGAFFAGVVLSESDFAHQAGAETRPVQDAFTVLFFVAIGMLFNPAVLVTHPLQLLASLTIVLIGKSLAAFAIVLLFKFPVSTALVISASLAQIGEFSFVLVALGISLDVLPDDALSIVVATAIASIALNPVIFQTVDPIKRMISRQPWANRFTRSDFQPEHVGALGEDEMRDHVILVGYGGVGNTIAKALVREQIPFIVVESDAEVFQTARDQGYRAILGDASRSEIMQHAGVRNARLLLVAIPTSAGTEEIIPGARELNPGLLVGVRTHDADEAVLAKSFGVERVVAAELELALEIAHYAVEAYGRPQDRIEGTIDELRSSELDQIARRADALREGTAPKPA